MSNHSNNKSPAMQSTLPERLRETGCNRTPFTPEHADCVCRLTSEAASEIEMLLEMLNDDPKKWSFDTLLEVGFRMLDQVYPESIFDGSSGDPGPEYVVALRNALERCDAIIKKRK